MVQYPGSLEELSARVNKLDSLQIALRTQPHSFVARFLEVKTTLIPFSSLLYESYPPSSLSFFG
jgi:hypothetical protein